VTGALPNGATGCIPALTATATATVRFIPPPGAEVCLIRPCEPNCPAPVLGLGQTAGVIPSSTKPGSLLIYNIYTSAQAASQDTSLALTNTGTQTAFTHMFLIDGQTCNVTDFFACLSGSQTAVWLASELDPGITGYMVVVAVEQNGYPTSYNYLLGSSRVKFSSGHAAVLNALAFSALYPERTVLPGFDPASSTAELKLDGVAYSLAPQMLAVSNFASPADNNSPLLIVNPVGGDLSSGEPVQLLRGLTGQVLNDKERTFSFIAPAETCQIRTIINERYPRIPFGLLSAIPSGSSGALRFSEVNGTPMMGSIINFNPDVRTSTRAFSQGHNLHHLTYIDKAKYIVPIIRPQF
jgi:hypothetical protein